MIPVTKPFLPNKDRYLELLDGIWERNWLTNNGPLLLELESSLNAYLELKNSLFVGNGTIAIQLVIKALQLTGEIITTPFSYVATTSSIAWEGCEPVFVDIDEINFNIDPDLIESKITNRTSAILTTHVFGNPCNIDKINAISERHNIPVIYDAAHCFGTKWRGKSIFKCGTVSTTSYHATKLFSTVEGGGVFSNDIEILNKVSYLRNFGHNGPGNFACLGINGKNSELHAAMGLANLDHIEEILATRKNQWLFYQELLKNKDVRLLEISDHTDYNYSYFPIVFNSEKQLLKCKEILESSNIYPRRYFNPSLNKLNYVNYVPCPVSESLSNCIMTLPLFHDLKQTEIARICEIIIDSLK